jgi:response regulator RpfG family c-di-GMP phosphodiesterase
MNGANKLDEIMKLSSELNNVQDLDILLERILSEARAILSADGGSIQIRENDELVFRNVQTDSLESRLQPEEKLPYNNFRIRINTSSISGYAALSGRIVNIPNAYFLPQDAPYTFNSSYDQKSNYHTKSMLTIPLKTNRNEILGVMQIVNKINEQCHEKFSVLNPDCLGEFSTEDELIAQHFANIASMVLQRAQMTRALILRMISMAELRDPKETGPHVNRVASYAVEIYEVWAKRRGISKHEIDRNRDIFRMAAMLHDVGKVAISDMILKKPAKFTPEEYEIMKTHSFHGAKLFEFRQSEFDEMSAVVALTHHENWDGTGYPGKIDPVTGVPLEMDAEGRTVPLKGEEIPIWGRIVSLADVYDALSSKRVYKEAWKEEDVLNEIRAMSGKKFDPELVDIFFSIQDILHSITERYPEEHLH